jgi:hypothetical protein
MTRAIILGSTPDASGPMAWSELAASCGVGTSRRQRPSIRAGLGARHPMLYAPFDDSCQNLAPTTHLDTLPKKRRKALLEYRGQGMQRVKAHADQPSPSPPGDPRHGVHFLEQPHQAIAL